MNIFQRFEVISKDALMPGDCFAGTVRETPMIGLAIGPQSLMKQNGFVAISPGHFDTGKAGIYQASVISSVKVLRFVEAQVVPDLAGSSFDLSFNGFTLPAGALICQDDRVYVATSFQTPTTVVAVDMADGSVFRLEGYDSAVFRSWSIVVPGLDGQSHTLCEIRLDGRGAAGVDGA